MTERGSEGRDRQGAKGMVKEGRRKRGGESGGKCTYPSRIPLLLDEYVFAIKVVVIAAIATGISPAVLVW